MGDDRAPLEISSPEKVLFPAGATTAAITKAEVVAHYQRVADVMLPLLGGRPLTLQRFPRGIEAKGFMQKNASKHFPASIARLPVPKRGGGTTLYPVVTRAEDIPYLANQNTITFHMWTSSAATPGIPDWLVIDLDPEDGDVAGARFATRAVADELARFSLSGFPLATGSTGFHVWVPITGATMAETSQASRALAGMAALHHPGRLTTEFLKKNRKGRVFVDWLRNTPTATTVVPFSLRPRRGAPAAVPLTWSELPTAVPDGWPIGSLGTRPPIICDPQPLPAGEIMAAARDQGVDLDTPHDRFGRA